MLMFSRSFLWWWRFIIMYCHDHSCDDVFSFLLSLYCHSCGHEIVATRMIVFGVDMTGNMILWLVSRDQIPFFILFFYFIVFRFWCRDLIWLLIWYCDWCLEIGCLMTSLCVWSRWCSDSSLKNKSHIPHHHFTGHDLMVHTIILPVTI